MRCATRVDDTVTALATATPGCTLCADDRAVAVAEHAGYRYVRCARCGLVYLHPRPSPDALLAAYDTYHGRQGGPASWDRLMRRVFAEAAALLEREPVPSRRLLDLGCGYGGFVALMRARGWQAEGIDPSPAVVASAVDAGRRVRQGTVESLLPARDRYAAVTMFYVLEHLADPLTTLRTVWELLVPGGALLLRVPHTTPIVRLLAPLGLGASLYDPPFHLYDFSPAVLRAILTRAGFCDVRVYPGRATAPAALGPRVASAAFGALARFFFAGTASRLLLPGVSKSALAWKPVR